ncbi:MAG: NUDIX hydrolase [Bryobacteraceae bacterium]|jgi:ADP-ribose pyrophosphatase YjhB (NUDIX family)
MENQPQSVDASNGASRRYPERPLLGVGAVVFHGGKLLLIQRGQEPLRGWWTLPGGLVETGERLEAAVRRETLEETGLSVAPAGIAAVFERIMPDGEGRTEFHYVIVDYLCELEGGDLCAASDVADAGWFTLDEMRVLKMAPGTPGVIQKAIGLMESRKAR